MADDADGAGDVIKARDDLPSNAMTGDVIGDDMTVVTVVVVMVVDVIGDENWRIGARREGTGEPMALRMAAAAADDDEDDDANDDRPCICCRLGEVSKLEM